MKKLSRMFNRFMDSWADFHCTHEVVSSLLIHVGFIGLAFGVAFIISMVAVIPMQYLFMGVALGSLFALVGSIPALR